MSSKYLSNIKTVLFLLFISLGMSSCSKDEPEEEQQSSGNIEVAVGTYIGRLTDYGNNGRTYYDAELIVTKVDDEHLKVAAKSGEPYSRVTEKIIRVRYLEYDGSVDEVSGNLSGDFSYRPASKTLRVDTNKQSEDDIPFFFEGTKQ